MTIGIRMKELRIKKEINQTSLAKLAGTSSQMISLIESDKNKPTLQLLTKLSEIFGVTADYLLTGKEGTNEISKEEQEVIEAMREDSAFKEAATQAVKVKKKAINYLGGYTHNHAHAA